MSAKPHGPRRQWGEREDRLAVHTSVGGVTNGHYCAFLPLHRDRGRAGIYKAGHQRYAAIGSVPLHHRKTKSADSISVFASFGDRRDNPAFREGSCCDHRILLRCVPRWRGRHLADGLSSRTDTREPRTPNRGRLPLIGRRSSFRRIAGSATFACAIFPALRRRLASAEARPAIAAMALRLRGDVRRYRFLPAFPSPLAAFFLISSDRSLIGTAFFVT